MSHVLERLRNRIHDSPMPAEHLMDDAADEIEHLRERLEFAEFEWNRATDHAKSLSEQLVQAKAAVRAAYIAGFEAFPGPKGQWDRAKISKRAAEEWETYKLSLPDEHREYEPQMNPVDDAEFGMKP